MDEMTYEGPTDAEYLNWNEANEYADERDDNDNGETRQGADFGLLNDRDEDDAVRMAEWEEMVRSRKAEPKAPYRWRMDYRWPVSAEAERPEALEGAQTYRNADTAYARVRDVTRAQRPDRRGPGRVIMTDRHSGEVAYYAINGKVKVNKMSDDPHAQPKPEIEPETTEVETGAQETRDGELVSEGARVWMEFAKTTVGGMTPLQARRTLEFFLGGIGAWLESDEDDVSVSALKSTLTLAAKFGRK